MVTGSNPAGPKKTKEKTSLLSYDRACLLFIGSFLDYDKCSYQNQ